MIKEELEKPKLKRKRKTNNYIDNEKMYNEMVLYRDSIQEYNKVIKNLKTGEQAPPKPKVSNYIGSAIMLIAQRLSTRPNFANYVHREEMIGDAIENCLMYIDNYDPKKSKNPFAYFTQIIYYAFLRRISKEKKQMYVKMKVLENLDTKGLVRKNISQHGYVNIDKSGANSTNVYAEVFNLKQSDIDIFEGKTNIKKKTNKKPSSSLEQCFE